MITWEIKKMFKTRNGLIGIVLFMILIISMVFIKPQLSGGNYNNQAPMSGDEEFKMKIEELKNASKNENKDEFSVVIKGLAERKLKVMESEEYKDVTFWQVFNHRAAHPFMIFIMLIIIIMFLSNIYTEEVISGVDSLILSARNRNKALYSKLALAMSFPMLIYMGYLIVEFIITYIQYGSPMNGSLQAIRIVDIPLLLKGAYTIYEYLLIKIAIMALSFITLGLLASMFSFLTRNSIQSISGFLAYIFLGKIMTLIKFLPKQVLLILSKVNYIDNLFNFNQSILIYTGKVKILSMNLDMGSLFLYFLIMTMIMGMTLAILNFKRFLKR